MLNKINYLNLYSLFKINLLKKIVIVLCNKIKDKKVSSNNLLEVIDNKEINLSTGINVIPYKSYIFVHQNKVKIFIWLLWFLDKKNRFSTKRHLNNLRFFLYFIDHDDRWMYQTVAYIRGHSPRIFTRNREEFDRRITESSVSNLELKLRSKNWLNNIYHQDSLIRKGKIVDTSYYQNYYKKKRLYKILPFDKKTIFSPNFRKRVEPFDPAKEEAEWRKLLEWRVFKSKFKNLRSYDMHLNQYIAAHIRNMNNILKAFTKPGKKPKRFIPDFPFIDPAEIESFDKRRRFKIDSVQIKKEEKQKFMITKFWQNYSRRLLVLLNHYLLRCFKSYKKYRIFRKHTWLGLFSTNHHFYKVFGRNFLEMHIRKINYFKIFNLYSFKIKNYFKTNIVNFFKNNHIKIFIKIGFSSVLKLLLKFQINNNMKFFQRKNLVYLIYLEQLVILFVLKDLSWFLNFILKEFKKRNKSFLTLLNLKYVLNNVSFFHFNILGFYLQIKGKLFKRSRRKVKHILSKGVRPIQPNLIKTYIKSTKVNLKSGAFGFKLWLLSIN